MKKEFTFNISYFKPSGKFYSDVKYTTTIKVCGNSSCPYMPDIVDKIRGLRDTGGQDALPGLSGSRWDGIILITCEEGYPCLILPN